MFIYVKVLIIGADNGPDEGSVHIGVQQGIRWIQKKYHFDVFIIEIQHQKIVRLIELKEKWHLYHVC